MSLDKYKIISFDKLDSTQTYAHHLIASKTARAFSVVLAESQTAGRGRYRRKWVSKPGNLYASFIYNNTERDPRVSYMVAVAIAETLLSFGAHPSIKWPNDILIDGKKISGVLIEYSGPFMIIGIGVNIKSAPTIADYKTTKLCNYSTVDRMEFLRALIRNLDIWMAADFPRVRARWMDLAAGLNKIVRYRDEMLELIGINDVGALILRRGTQYIYAYGDEVIM